MYEISMFCLIAVFFIVIISELKQKKLENVSIWAENIAL